MRALAVTCGLASAAAETFLRELLFRAVRFGAVLKAVDERYRFPVSGLEGLFRSEPPLFSILQS